VSSLTPTSTPQEVQMTDPLVWRLNTKFDDTFWELVVGSWWLVA
jgi:hypothetical protein